MHMFPECPYVQKVWKTIWNLFSIFTAEIIDTKMCNIIFILCTYNKQKPNLHCNFHNCNAYIFACKYADKIPDPVECWHKIEYYQETERLIFTENNKLQQIHCKVAPLPINISHAIKHLPSSV